VKRIEAIIRPEKLEAVVEALEAELGGIKPAVEVVDVATPGTATPATGRAATKGSCPPARP